VRPEPANSLLQLLAPKTTSHLEHVAFPRHHLVQHGIDEESDEEAGDEAGHDDDGEGTLRVGADAGGERGGQQAEAGDERGHHDGTEAQERGFARGGTDSHAFSAQLVDVGDEDDGGLDGDAE
jgi:hypothetical protein